MSWAGGTQCPAYRYRRDPDRPKECPSFSPAKSESRVRSYDKEDSEHKEENRSLDQMLSSPSRVGTGEKTVGYFVDIVSIPLSARNS